MLKKGKSSLLQNTVRPILEYASVAREPHPQKDAKTIYGIQNKICKTNPT